MADVYSIFGTLLALGIAFPGMLFAWWLLFPNSVERAAQRVEQTPWRSLFSGIPIFIGMAIPIILLFSISVPFAKFLAALMLFSSLGFAGMGAAGIALKMSRQLKIRSNDSLSDSGAFIRAAVALELAAAFPLIGWLVVIPITIITSLGAAVSAILSWKPKKSTRAKQTIDASSEAVKA